MKIISDFKRFLKIRKIIKKISAIAKDNSQLGIDTQKAILNVKASIEVLCGLIPSYKPLYDDIKALLDE